MRSSLLVLLAVTIVAATVGFFSIGLVQALDWVDVGPYTFDFGSQGDYKIEGSYYYSDNTSTSVHLWYANEHIFDIHPDSAEGVASACNKLTDGTGYFNYAPGIYGYDPVLGSGDQDTKQWWRNETWDKPFNDYVRWDLRASFTGACSDPGAGEWTAIWWDDLSITKYHTP